MAHHPYDPEADDLPVEETDVAVRLRKAITHRGPPLRSQAPSPRGSSRRVLLGVVVVFGVMGLAVGIYWITRPPPPPDPSQLAPEKHLPPRVQGIKTKRSLRPRE